MDYPQDHNYLKPFQFIFTSVTGMGGRSCILFILWVELTFSCLMLCIFFLTEEMQIDIINIITTGINLTTKVLLK